MVGGLTAEQEGHGVEVFATIDHGSGARALGLASADEVPLTLHDPAVATTLRRRDTHVGSDLPLRMLVMSEDGRSEVAHRDPVAFGPRNLLGGRQTP